MGGYIKPIGGEYYFNKSLFNKNVDNLSDISGVFFNGGQSAIRFILEELKLNDDEIILMPSYLCPTVLYNFKKLNIKYDFYEVNEDLSINIDSLIDKIKVNNVKAIFFIDYFGFYHKEEVLSFLCSLKTKGIVIIEDAVQMFWFTRREKFIGDYVFNSFRKFLPIDGSIVLCNKSMEFTYTYDSYYQLMKESRILKSKYVNNGLGNEDEYLKFFKEANIEYYKREKIYGLDPISKYMLNKVDCNLIETTRIENYWYLYDKLKKNSMLKVIFNKNLIKDNIPLGLPIIIENRNLVRTKLMNYNIYCPVHWDLDNMNQLSVYSNSVNLSMHILTLPIDNRYNKKDLDYLINCLMSEIN